LAHQPTSLVWEFGVKLRDYETIETGKPIINIIADDSLDLF
jgi:hypothetical protein